MTDEDVGAVVDADDATVFLNAFFWSGAGASVLGIGEDARATTLARVRRAWERARGRPDFGVSA